MLDAQNRLGVSKRIFPDNPFNKDEEVYFYYMDEKKLSMSIKEEPSKMLVGKGVVDEKGRFTVPVEIVKAFGSRNVIVGKQEGEYYLIFFPMKKD